MTGIFVRRLSPMQVRPLPIEMAQTQEPVCALSRCPAAAAARTMTSGPEYETTTATNPARTADSDISARSPRRPGEGASSAGGLPSADPSGPAFVLLPAV